MGTQVDVLDINQQKHMGKVAISLLDRKYDEWRAKGYGVLIDRGGDVCLDDEDTDDDGLYYSQQLKELEELLK